LNPEMIIEAQENIKFKNIINEADLVIPDGIGILWALDFLGKKNKSLGRSLLFISTLLKLLFNSKHRRNILQYRTHGIDLIYKICGSEHIENKRIFLLGAGEGIAEKTAKVLSQKYDHLNIVGAEEGIKMNQELGIRNDDLIQRINKAQSNIIFVAFGAPKQEIWIHENLKKMTSIKLAIGVGGSFDFISGKIKRAPLIFQRSGLEWLWRLVREPKRIKRIYNATARFGWMVLRK
ncbi:WecB/TagA/CpsF family glycosyltransferase, partial [Candidatus Parcubacteria bacterium]|nr:WecB/TagA/CpsF family glycosyltransferase [Candidatus Parcubacteria bacterium]